MATETELLRLALAAYEAASEPDLWSDFLKRYAEAISADTTYFQMHDWTTRTSFMRKGFGLSSTVKQSYHDYYSKINIWRDRGRPLFIPGRVNLDHEHCPRPDLERSEFYNDCLKPFRVVYSMSSVIAGDRTHSATLGGLRGPAKHPFSESERKIAQFLLPHVQRAWTIAKRLDLLTAGESVLNTLPIGVVFLGADGAVIYCNRAAEAIIASNDGLNLRNGLLTAHGTPGAQIRKSIEDALAPVKRPSSAAVSVPRLSLRRNYQVVTAPLLSRFGQFIGMASPKVLVLITDPELQAPSYTALLRQLFKLTRKEAAIAAKLSTGKSVERTAEELSITYETARTHLRRIFSKTGTSRQAELLLLIARLPVVQDRDPPWLDSC